MSENRLFRSRKNRIVAGVCGGLAKYLHIDTSLVRIVAVLITLLGGSGVLVYIILWIAIPEEPDTSSSSQEAKMSQEKDSENSSCCSGESNSGQLLAGTLLVVVGAILLFNNLLPELALTRLWPLGLVVFGVWLLTRHKEEK